ncbi:OmpP1/FadL family transporter [Aeromonas allosaccharophila]|uniref:Outer membrane protein transport protein n=1 Tax=Aeromonas allosaccharophila TaxID=656 RepID=A0A7T2PIQ1_9GAMM|nr:outer membrane protein transport protein [Aeromonas allosaccharophila]QPR56439.1 outer membrane protein transport protein [Aeromonas allosaccharophila]
MQQRLLSLMLAALLSPSAMAGGLALYETSTANSALANAGAAARAQGAETIASNPAGMTKLEGTQLQVNGGVVYGDLELDLDNGGNNGGNALQTAPLGSVYLTHAINDQWVAGFGMFGSHGLGIDYGEGWEGSGYVEAAKLTGIAFAPSLAYRIDANWSVGASLIAMHGSLDTSLDVAAAGLNPIQGQEFSDSDWAYGASFGVLYELDQHSRIGLSYFSELKWELEDQLFTHFNLAGLGVDMMIPQTVTLSGYHQLNDQWALLASANWQQWSRFGDIDVTTQRRSRSVDMHYKDTWHLSLGTQFDVTPALRLSSGIAYDSSAVDDAHRTVNLPMGEGWRWGLGASYQLSPATRLEASYTLAWLGDMSVNQESPYGVRKDISGTYNNSYLNFFNIGVQHQF